MRRDHRCIRRSRSDGRLCDTTRGVTSIVVVAGAGSGHLGWRRGCRIVQRRSGGLNDGPLDFSLSWTRCRAHGLGLRRQGAAGLAEGHQPQSWCRRVRPTGAPTLPEILSSAIRCRHRASAVPAPPRVRRTDFSIAMPRREVSLGALQVWQALTERVSGRPANREVTLVFTDLVGFSDWALRAGDEATLRLLRRVTQVMEPPLLAAGGQIVKRMGDGAMAVFTDPATAVEAVLVAMEAVKGVEVDGYTPGCGRVCTPAARSGSVRIGSAWTSTSPHASWRAPAGVGSWCRVRRWSESPRRG